MALSVSVLKLRDFRLLLITRTLVTMAMLAQDVVIGWQIYSLTRSVLMLGLIGLAEAVPAITCALFSGHFVDKGRPYRIYFTSIAVLAMNSFFLLLLAGGLVSVSSHILIICIFSGIMLSGVTRSFLMPSSFSMLSITVPRPQIPAASAWFTSSFQIAAISGPAIAGLIYGSLGVFYAWLLPFVFIVAGTAMALTIGKERRGFTKNIKREPAIQSIKAGWGFILKNDVLLSIMALDMFAVLFGGAVAMLPAFADQVLHIGSEGLGVLRAAPAIGSIGMALFLALKPMKRVHGVVILPIVAAFGICMIGFGLSHTFPIAMLFLVLSGAFDSVSMVMRSTLIQLLTPEYMRGRVASIGSMFVISSNEIGAFESGVAAKLLGLTPSIIIGGVCTLVVVAATYFLAPGLRKSVIDPSETLLVK